MLTLYDDVFSPYPRKVRIALYEKDARVDREERLRAVLLDEMRAGRAFFPLATSRSG